MKRIALLILISLTVNAFGQKDPFSRLFFKSLWPDIMEYDSIVFSTDTGSAFMPESTVSMWLFNNSHYDSARTYENNALVTKYEGNRYSDSTVIITYYETNGGFQAAQKYVFQNNASARDTAVIQYSYNGSGYSLDQKFRLNYNSNNTLSNIGLIADISGNGNLTNIGGYEFYYTGTRVDSLIGSNIFDGENLNVINYYSGNQLTDSYLIVYSMGNADTTELYNFTYNNQREIIIIHKNSYDETTRSFELEDNWYYFQRQHTNLSLPEENGRMLSLYPNPVIHTLQVENADTFDQFKVVSLNGQVLMNGDFEGQLEVDKLQPGLYMLVLSNGTHQQTLPFHKL
ncbi:MAG TPA: hypothetical protein DCG19_12615 [Cryomorphaceae bacterium]|nr:hypothetical protein [Owenweeksia sp.]MBF98913.1 hypothetical protein [Owenweeksia sp.]HAD98244.1 hypothetical protein [Cryomorphaceae bacterium]HBF20520.1 hypothetical protein [Cryomorphaceae bacterium]HCQ14687.1 hypothetical protein [Cryomorphaceae bacterium]|tara:strand:- start:536 stop:1564 length:1029 start_codon:yes stop_codon:yes gene_type:complete